MSNSLTLVDYGMGNLGSVLNAFVYLGARITISNNPAQVAKADALLLPGVGSFRAAMSALNTSGLSDAIREAVVGRDRKILGICLGMQLLGTSSTEDGKTSGIGLISAPVDRFNGEAASGYKVPHVGFNSVSIGDDSILMRGLHARPDFYFVHSYRMLPGSLRGCVSTCDYDGLFVAAIEQGNIFATQFHPEKSQTNGLVLLKNFLLV